MDNLRDLVVNAEFLGRKHVDLRMRPNMASGLDSRPTSKESNDGQTGSDIGWRWCLLFVGEWGEAQEYLGRHHAMSRTHHNYYASIPRRESDIFSFGRTCPWKPEVLIDLSDSAYPLYAYTALHYRPLHDSGSHPCHDVERHKWHLSPKNVPERHQKACFGPGNGPKIRTVDRLNGRMTDSQDFPSAGDPRSQRSQEKVPQAADAVSSVTVSVLASARANTEGTNGSLNPSIEIEINGMDSVPQLFAGAVLSCSTPMTSSASERAGAATQTTEARPRRLMASWPRSGLSRSRPQ
ncbi:unnamed protein product [Spirodela intermedia]|uniref:Uncharacterized protein n=1 Tax=Spirodela intermedia TaxID=51605 RepID=A0ABN7EDB1_SPIIN|nr:unnamed protein product [Spirodela intermedia]